MSNEATFVPVGVKAEDAPHVVVHHSAGEIEIKPVLGWHVLTNGCASAVVADNASYVGPVSGPRIHGHTVHASLADAKQFATRLKQEDRRMWVRFLEIWHDKFGSERLSSNKLFEVFTRDVIPPVLRTPEEDFDYDRIWETLANLVVDTAPYELVDTCEDSDFRVTKTA